MNRSIRCVPVRSPTLPPATHTNVWVLGADRLTVVDPASPWPEEQHRLATELEALGTVQQIVLTHHHVDHVSGALDLQKRTGAPILAHPLTIERLGYGVPIPDQVCGFTVLHTPGHAPGHVVLHADGDCIAGDMVAGVGTIAIHPEDDGHLGTYLDSLERLRAMGFQRLFPAHGPILDDADAILSHYLSHRRARTDQIFAALTEPCTPVELAPRVYTELDPRFFPLAAVQITAHLIWLEEHSRVTRSGAKWLRADGPIPEPN